MNKNRRIDREAAMDVTFANVRDFAEVLIKSYQSNDPPERGIKLFDMCRRTAKHVINENKHIDSREVTELTVLAWIIQHREEIYKYLDQELEICDMLDRL